MSVIWNTGAGSLTCPFPGTPYSRRFSPESPSPDCGTVYDHAARGLSVSAAIRYEVTWRAFGAVSTGGTLAALTGPASQANLDVFEVQSIN